MPSSFVGGSMSVVALFAAAGSLLVGSPPAAATLVASGGQAASVLGTIQATVDGTPRTWYVVGGKSGGRDYTSGGWIEPAPGQRIVSIGGFDSQAPPLETFGWDTSGNPTSFGAYRGSVLNLVIAVDGGASTVELSFPPANPAIIYMPTASLTDMQSAYAIATGTLDVTRVSFTGGNASADGTFSGTLQQLSGTGSIEVTGGRFAVKGLPSLVR